MTSTYWLFSWRSGKQLTNKIKQTKTPGGVPAECISIAGTLCQQRQEVVVYLTVESQRQGWQQSQHEGEGQGVHLTEAWAVVVVEGLKRCTKSMMRY